MAAVTVDGSLEIDLAHALESTDEEGVHRHQSAGKWCFDMAFAELRREAFQEPDLVFLQLDLAFACGLFQPEQAGAWSAGCGAATRP